MPKVDKKEVYTILYGHLLREYEGIHFVAPIAIDNNVISILCPYCKEIHHHGNRYGHRVPHCKSPTKNLGYVIVPDLTDETVFEYAKRINEYRRKDH